MPIELDYISKEVRLEHHKASVLDVRVHIYAISVWPFLGLVTLDSGWRERRALLSDGVSGHWVSVFAVVLTFIDPVEVATCSII